ncbi:Omp85 family outer membrane protein [Paraliomyxa miuraensis]|uniref:Omp85 family outer membrane protein n=1 Tax=Paraliomyxa miuraensis TaxID=376150 RepID=UPI002259D1A9|nr:BamA/TamA family outer membrane protein [Paraliomyxa miuraensis]MCX4242192.1 BamA/TamA family outer membrane protein [Paraliomyxa miuraensis]
MLPTAIGIALGIELLPSPASAMIAPPLAPDAVEADDAGDDPAAVETEPELPAEPLPPEPPPEPEAVGPMPPEVPQPSPPATAGEGGEDGQAPSGRRGRKGRKGKENDPERLEFGGLPATNYDTDLGVGFGAIATLAKFYPGYRPYRWRIEALLYATAKRAPGGGVEIPFHDDYVTADIPGLANKTLRLNIRVGFRKFTTTGYYGLGNGAPATKPWEAFDPQTEPDAYQAARRYHQYDRTYPGFDFTARIKAWDRSITEHKRRLEVFVGTAFAYSFIRPYAGSKLEEDIAAAREDTEDGRTLANLLRGTDDHALLKLNLGLLWDTRDHEYVPTRGTFTELSTRVSPGVQDELHHAGFTLNTSWYQALLDRYLVFAVRGVGDVIVGNAPFYELARYGAFTVRDGPGGSWSLRGVPRQRFHGKGKLVSNIELRSEFLPFSIRSQRFMLGAIAFFDAGRVWADLRPTEIGGVSLDTRGVAVGVGGGVRLRWGETFIVRVDPSYSPTEDNFGIYIDVGHIF